MTEGNNLTIENDVFYFIYKEFWEKELQICQFLKVTFWLVHLDQCIALEAIKEKSPTINFICYKVQSVKIPKWTSKH